MNLLELKSLLDQYLPTWKWTLPPDPKLGVLSSPKAFEDGKIQKTNPNIVAIELLETLKQVISENNLPITAEVTGPYLNVQANDSFLDNLISNLETNFTIPQNMKKVLLEYVSPNIAKPLHAGHLVNAVIGETLKQTLALKYRNLESEIYWGDWGIQFGIILWAWKKIGNETVELELNGEIVKLTLEDYAQNPIETLVKVYVWGNQQKYTVEGFDEQIRTQVLNLENKDPELLNLWQMFSQDSKKVISKSLKQLGVSNFNHQFGESYYQNRMMELTKFMDKHNLWEVEGKGRFIDLDKLSQSWEEDNNIILSTANEDNNLETLDTGEIPFNKISTYGRCYLIQSKDGYTTYPFRDIAARWHWAEDLQADLMITLTDHTQTHNFHQAFSIISYLASKKEFLEISNDQTVNKLNYNNLVHIPYGFLKLPEGKMSTRKGNFVTAEDILEQIQTQAISNLQERYPDLDEEELQERSLKLSLAAIKWTVLSKDIIKDTVLNIPQILTFEGNTGVYQLYTFARLNSILTKNSHTLNSSINFTIEDLNDQEKLILNQLNQLPIVLEEICLTYKPHTLSTYLFNLSTLINNWYGKVSVSNEEDKARQQSLLFFCQYLAKHLQKTLGLMGIETLEVL